MKMITRISFAGILLLATVSFALAQVKNVVVLYNGQSETNREASKFIKAGFRQSAPEYSLKFTNRPNDITPGAQKAVVIINSGLSDGIDPVFATFIKNYTKKNELIVINLVRGSRDTNVSMTTAQNGSLGVDAITAASAWGSNTWFQVHSTWLDQIIKFIK